MTEIEAALAAAHDRYVLVLSDCMPVRGHTVSAVYDLTRGTISTFPTAYFALFELFATHRVGELLAEFEDDDLAELRAFLDFLLRNEFIAFVDDRTAFPAIPSGWDAPGALHDAIIDVDTRDHDYPAIIGALDRLGCQHLQVRSFARRFGIAELAALARLCHGTSIESLQAWLPHDPAIADEVYVDAMSSHRLIVGLVLHSADEARELRVDYGARGAAAALVVTKIELTTARLTSHLDCGVITTRELLRPSTPTFNELRQFSGCLNRKLAIGADGLVRNCPAMAATFGDHAAVALDQVVANPRFQQAWRARTDDVEVCRDCAYRYACTGCRALLADPEVATSKPLKCGYDPYTDTWSDWRARPGAAAVEARYRERRYLPVVV